jgi:DNA-binding PadR family transcriptional regulator
MHKLSSKEAVILGLLVSAGPMYGLELVGASGGALKRGTVYVTLGRMEDKGYVRSRHPRPAAGVSGMPRPIYLPTPLGVRVFKAWERFALALSRVEA